ncbi:MAG TPA: response regulator [Terracidiphilus sp.]|jgi:DNA-binding response OmpR family regulator|nr:response regulator [Terracidiphilus sp.]
MPTKVFVVDDETVIADTLAVILNTSGYEARAFYDGESALLACEISCPNCVIGDVVMPGISGVDMALQIRHRFPACKVLLFSGQAASASILEAAGRDGQGLEVLQKPVHPKDMLARLRALLPLIVSSTIDAPVISL